MTPDMTRSRPGHDPAGPTIPRHVGALDHDAEHMTSAAAPRPLPDRLARGPSRHYLEMAVAMVVGMVVLGAAVGARLARPDRATRTSWP